jgi:ATP-dependent DNA helicase RecG
MSKSSFIPILKLKVLEIQFRDSDNYYDLTVTLSDGRNCIKAYWITKNKWYRNTILDKMKIGQTYYFRGMIIYSLPYFIKNIIWNFQNTISEKGHILDTNNNPIAKNHMLFPEFFSNIESALMPRTIYHIKNDLTSRIISLTINKILQFMENKSITNLVPKYIRQKYNFFSRKKAFQNIHKPPTLDNYQKGLRSLIFEEAWSLHIPLLSKKKLLQEKIIKSNQTISKSSKYTEKKKILNIFDNSFDFKLTNSQLAANNKISKAINSSIPIKWLLQGDVASGKTIVALRAMIDTALSGGQSALLAPTIIIGWQHYYFIKNKLEQLYKNNPNFPKIEVELINSTITGKNRQKILEKVNSNKTKLLIGTTSLLHLKSEFKNLKLIVIDEQHKYGVAQRNTLDGPHIISMTATPIPRTVALSIFADYEIITLEKPETSNNLIKTELISSFNLKQIEFMKNKILHEAKNGKQIILIVPRIKPDKKALNIQNIESIYNEYKNDKFFKNCQIKFIHGKLKSEVKKDIMNKMKNCQIDILVSTTVIEVGVDLKKASTIVIYNAAFFSIAELHQLRGRVARDSNYVSKGFCYLICNSENQIAQTKLENIKKYNNGFTLSKIDLKLRGEGDILGKAQSGKKSSLKIMRILDDFPTLELSYKLAKKYINSQYFNLEDVKYLEDQSWQIYSETNEFLNKI